MSNAIHGMRAEGAKPDIGSVVKKVLDTGGLLEKRPVDRGQVARHVRGMLVDASD